MELSWYSVALEMQADLSLQYLLRDCLLGDIWPRVDFRTSLHPLEIEVPASDSGWFLYGDLEACFG